MAKSTIPLGLCKCGCGGSTSIAPQSHTKHGYVKGMPVSYINGHWPRKSNVDYLEQDTGFDTLCWIWQRGIASAGYGVTKVNNKAISAHRLYYIRAKGSIPEGLELDHLCRNRACVNPDHLEAVSRQENIRRGAAIKIDDAAVRLIRMSQMPVPEIVRRFGVTPSYARLVLEGTQPRRELVG